MNTPATQAAPEEHDFAPFIRILGKGKTGSRSLTEAEAKQAMQLILADKVKDVQLGAFLMLLRVKEESPEELAGFASAVRESLNTPSHITADLDWSSYAGKRRQQNWYLLSALCLADHGIRTFMHGAAGHTAGRLYSEQALHALGIETAKNWQDVEQQLKQNNFSFYSLSDMCPILQTLMDYRNDFGLRSPVHSLSRIINPLQATYSVQSIFHPSYADSHRQANALQQQAYALVFKGEAGEVERRPEARTLTKTLIQGELQDEQWPMLLSGRQEQVADLSAAALKLFWEGQTNDDYGHHAVIGTIAIILKFLQKSHSQEEAMQMAEQLWNSRNKEKFTA